MADAYVTLISIQPTGVVRTAFQRFPLVAHAQGQRQHFTALYPKRQGSKVFGASATGSEGAGV